MLMRWTATPPGDWMPACGSQDSNLQLQQQLGMAGGGAAGDGGASVEGFSPSMLMAGTPQDWVEPRGSSLEREGAMGMVGSPAIGTATLQGAAALQDQAAARQLASTDADQSAGAAADDDMVQDMEL